MFSTNSPRKLYPLHLRSFMYRKYLEIITIITIITLCGFLISTQFLRTFKTFNVIGFNNEPLTNLTAEQQKLPLDLHEHTTYSPLALKLKEILNCIDTPLRMEKIQHGDYWMLKNYIRGRKSIHMGCGESITYTTNGDFTFMVNLPVVVKR